MMDSKYPQVLGTAIFVILILAACNLPNRAGQDVNNEGNSNSTTGEQTSNTGSGADIPDFPAKQVCEELSGHVALNFPLNIFLSQENFEQAASGLGGAGCRVFTSGNGIEISDWNGQVGNVLSAIRAGGWNSDANFSGAGAGGELITYRQGGFVCQLITEVKPMEPSLCADEALAACLAGLAPEQILYELTIDCSPDLQDEETTSDDLPHVERERIVFDPGATTATLHGSLPASETFPYVLRAEAGQQLVVSLRTIPPLSGLITIFGEDGGVLLSDHGDSMFWYGDLTVSQDYFITLRSYPEWPVDYSLEVIIPPVGETYIGSYTPLAYEACRALADQIGQALGVEAYMTTALFQDHFSQTAGSGCLITAWGDGVQFPDWSGSTSAAIAAIEAEGWVEDAIYAAGGARGISTAYRKDGSLCIYAQSINEISRALCPGDQPVSACWENLAPEQMIYSVTMNCAAQ
jgi:hypothetical protein